MRQQVPVEQRPALQFFAWVALLLAVAALARQILRTIQRYRGVR
jgi:hypothetical protein